MSIFGLDAVTEALQGTRVSPLGVSFQGKALKLNTEEDAKVVVEAINNCTTLEFLNLEGNTLGVDAAKAIATALEKHPEFKRALWKDLFTGRMKTEIPKALEFLGSGLVTASARLKELDLSDNAFGPIGVQGLASLLRSSSCYGLEELRLNNNGLGIGGGKLLSSALIDCYNTSKAQGKPLALKVFIAGRNRLENEGAKALAKFFKTVGTLEEIAIPQNGIYHVGITALMDAFTHNKNLHVLNLNDNTIGPKGAEALFQALPVLTKLKVINFGDCLLKSKGASLLAKALQGGHGDLEELILESNEIRIDAALELADAIANKAKLRVFTLDANQLNDEAQGKVRDKLKAAGKVNVLSLEDCESEDEDDEEAEGDDSHSETEEEEEDEDGSVSTHNVSLDVSLKSCTFSEFSNQPTAETFLGLGEERVDIILQELKKNTSNFVDPFVAALMKIGGLYTSTYSSAKQTHGSLSAHILSASERLYKELFNWAQENDSLSIVNNSILVHMGLIKSEDKSLKITWNLPGSFSVLEGIITQNYVPSSTRETLRFFLQRKDKPTNDDQAIVAAKQSLLKVLT